MIHIKNIDRDAVRFQICKQLIVICDRTDCDDAGPALLPCLWEVHVGSFLADRLVHLCVKISVVSVLVVLGFLILILLQILLGKDVMHVTAVDQFPDKNIIGKQRDISDWKMF